MVACTFLFLSLECHRRYHTARSASQRCYIICRIYTPQSLRASAPWNLFRYANSGLIDRVGSTRCCKPLDWRNNAVSEDCSYQHYPCYEQYQHYLCYVTRITSITQVTRGGWTQNNVYITLTWPLCIDWNVIYLSHYKKHERH